jgi:transposase
MEDLTSTLYIKLFSRQLEYIKKFHTNNQSEAIRIALDKLKEFEILENRRERINNNLVLLMSVLLAVLIGMEAFRIWWFW